MSRAYRIRVSESVTQTIHVEDGVQTTLEILNVLPADQMSELLAAELEEQGFERDGNIMRRSDDDGIEIEVNLEDGAVTVRLAGASDVDLKVERSRLVAEESQAGAEEALRESARRQLDSQVEAERAKLTEEVANKLESKLRDIQNELDGVTTRVTRDALKEKAKSMGEIEEITEDAETGSMTIKVKV